MNLRLRTQEYPQKNKRPKSSECCIAAIYHERIENSTFARAIYLTMQEFSIQFVATYIDDMAIYSSTQDGRLDHFRELLEFSTLRSTNEIETEEMQVRAREVAFAPIQL